MRYVWTSSRWLSGSSLWRLNMIFRRLESFFALSVLALTAACSGTGSNNQASGGSSSTGGESAAGGTAGGGGSMACGPTLQGQQCQNDGKTCVYPNNQCRCTTAIWLCSLCPASAPNTGASCGDITSVCTYNSGTIRCTCGGIPLPTWSCAQS